MTIEELKTKSLEELKVLAYDQLEALANVQSFLSVLQNLIKEKSEPQVQKK